MRQVSMDLAFFVIGRAKFKKTHVEATKCKKAVSTLTPPTLTPKVLFGALRIQNHRARWGFKNEDLECEAFLAWRSVESTVQGTSFFFHFDSSHPTHNLENPIYRSALLIPSTYQNEVHSLCPCRRHWNCRRRKAPAFGKIRAHFKERQWILFFHVCSHSFICHRHFLLFELGFYQRRTIQGPWWIRPHAQLGRIHPLGRSRSQLWHRIVGPTYHRCCISSPLCLGKSQYQCFWLGSFCSCRGRCPKFEFCGPWDWCWQLC